MKRSELPQIIADLLNSTLGELDGKLDLLSNLEWQIDPFLKSELGIILDIETWFK